jgi:hypothetical protein
MAASIALPALVLRDAILRIARAQKTVERD